MTELQDLASVSDGARLAGVLPYVEVEIDRMEKALDNKVFSFLDQGALTNEMAMGAWIEKRSYRKLARTFGQRVRMGQSAGTRQQELLDLPLPGSTLVTEEYVQGGQS